MGAYSAPNRLNYGRAWTRGIPAPTRAVMYRSYVFRFSGQLGGLSHEQWQTASRTLPWRPRASQGRGHTFFMRFFDRRADVKTIGHCLAVANGADVTTGRPRANGFTEQPDNRTGRGRCSRRRRPPRAGRTNAESDHRLPGRRTERARIRPEERALRLRPGEGASPGGGRRAETASSECRQDALLRGSRRAAARRGASRACQTG